MKKKYFIAALFAASALFTSCNMDLAPYGDLDDSTAIQGVNDVFRFRNGLYTSMRGITTGSFVYITDLQADEFQGTIDNGNRMGIISAGSILSSDGDITAKWSSMYSIINSANYLIEKIEGMLATAEWSQQDIAALKRYDAEARFVRAYCYYWLADRFCEVYSPETAQAAHKGLPLVTKYHPTGDSSTYPGRSTQDETYKMIDDDLVTAYQALLEYEKQDPSNLAPNAAYISSDVVLALQARIALMKGDNATALSKAEAVIKTNRYPLTTIDKYQDLWTKDEGTEVLFRPIMTAQELGNSTGGTYLGVKLNSADYVPTYDVMNLYEVNDIRLDTYFTVWELSSSKVKGYVFNKYPGNESLKTGADPNYMNMPKPFRASELYLIAAEAAAETNAVLANKYLNELRSNRIKDYQSVNLSGQSLINAIREERQKELLGEGFRLSDLRRWNQGFQRNPSHPEAPEIESILTANSKSVAYTTGDHRFVWPIPSDEMQTNPQLEGQQNPGY